MTDNILQEQEWEEYDSQLHDAGSEHGSLALASSSEEAASTGMAGGPFLWTESLRQKWKQSKPWRPKSGR